MIGTLLKLSRLLIAGRVIRLAMWRAPEIDPETPLGELGFRGFVGAVGMKLAGESAPGHLYRARKT